MGFPAAVEAKLGAALAAELVQVERVERAAFDDASRSAARGWRMLYNVHVANAAKVRASGDVDKLAELLANIARSAGTPSVVLTEAERRTIIGAVKEVGGGIARDAAQLATDTGKGWLALLRASPLVLLVLLVVAVVVFSGSLARRVPAPGGTP